MNRLTKNRLTELLQRLYKHFGGKDTSLPGLSSKQIGRLVRGENGPPQTPTAKGAKIIGEELWKYIAPLANADTVKMEVFKIIRDCVAEAPLAFATKEEFATFFEELAQLEQEKPTIELPKPSDVSDLPTNGSIGEIVKKLRDDILKWRDFVCNRGVDFKSNLRKLLSEESFSGNPIVGPLSDHLMTGPMAGIFSSVENNFFGETNARRKALVLLLIGHAQISIDTVSDWDSDTWNEDSYTETYLGLVRDRNIRIRRIFFYSQRKDGVHELCQQLNSPPEGTRAGTIKALAISIDELKRKSIKNLWLMDGYVGTRSFARDKNEQVRDLPNHFGEQRVNGEVFWGGEAVKEVGWFNELWLAHKHLH